MFQKKFQGIMKDSSNNIINLINLLYPIQRNANSIGVDKSLKFIKDKILTNSKIHNYKSGLKIEDWEVPKRWELKNAFIKDQNGKIIDPNIENPPKEEEFFYIVTDKCTECNGFHDEPQCAAVCPVDCCITDDDNIETKDELLEKKSWLHKD